MKKRIMSGVRPDLLSMLMGRMAGHVGPVVLMYHSIEVTSGMPEWRWAVSLDRFREQVDYLVSEGWSFLRLDQLEHDRSRQAKEVVITFDDAYADTLPAANVLASGNLPACWFVVSSALAGQSTWVDQG